jgi:L-seryl-tRNA(Ser) seleniumtransferase
LRTAQAALPDEANPLYRMLPPLGELLLRPEFAALAKEYSRQMLVDVLRAILAEFRDGIRVGVHTEATLREEVSSIASKAGGELRRGLRPTLVPVLNATGVLLHTNLGRAPLSRTALQRIVEVSQGYSNLELDLNTGQRGQRDSHAGPSLLRFLAAKSGQSFAELTATRSIAIVNNCAAATFLALNTLAEGGEVIVSRGELVEIGGSFRIPEILAKSGALLREVGTTNRTRVTDYEAAIGANTRIILRVHQSNFKIEGFTERPALRELVELGSSRGVPVFEDQGTGLLLPPEELGFAEESSLLESLRGGPDLIAASGDKLLGGPQCGLLVGSRNVIEQIRRNPLFRTFRVDKLTYAALEATLADYLAGREDEIPLVLMMRVPARTIRLRCEALVDLIDGLPFEPEVVRAASVVGGGTTPGSVIESFAVSLRCESLTASSLLAALRRQAPPLIGRIEDERVLLDLRTIPPDDDAAVVRTLTEVASGLTASTE